MSDHPKPADESRLRESLATDPADWESRKQLARLLYDRGDFQDAADLVWETDELPSIDVELAFAARVLAKASPRKSIRLLSALLEHNQGKAVQNLGMANALLHHGMVLQAARFYGAALESDPSFGNPDLEHFLLWTDDEERLWGDFRNRAPKLGELPWMKRDPEEAMKLTSRISTHTTPVKLPSLPPAPGEELGNELYQQKAGKAAAPTPPPAVTIPLDRVDPKHRLFDEELGAPAAVEPAGEATADEPPAAKAVPPPVVTPKPSLPTAGPPTKKLQFGPPAAGTPKPGLPPLKKPDAVK